MFLELELDIYLRKAQSVFETPSSELFFVQNKKLLRMDIYVYFFS